MKVRKAYEITDARIQFVSLVDKAANLKKFLITKAEDGRATFSTYGRIIRKDTEHHFVTGIVYEPMAEDAHGNYMTEEEITKAAYYFAKAGGKVDLQHSFEPLPGADVVESWIAKADFDVEGETVKKGTWLMTVELADTGLWDAIEKGEITGFSMGGVGNYSEEDVDLDSLEKSTGKQAEQNERKSIFKKLAQALGFEVIEKGEMADLFVERNRSNQFWTAFSALQDVLVHYDGFTCKQWLETDETAVREALEDFSAIVQQVLTKEEPVTKSIAKDKPVLKVGKKMSGKNREMLEGIYETLGTFLASFKEPDGELDDPEEKPPEESPDGSENGDEGGEGEENKEPTNDEEDKEDKEVKKSEVEKMVQEAVAASVKKALGVETPAPAEPLTAEAVQKMVYEAISKALTHEGQREEVVTAESITKMVEEAVDKAVAPVLKARGVPSALNDGKPVEKQQEQHYLHGIL